MIHIGSVGGGGGRVVVVVVVVVERARTGRFTSGSPRTSTGRYRSMATPAGTNCVFRLHWWYLLVVGSCMQCSMVFSIGGKYPSWYVVPSGSSGGIVWVRPGRF